MRVSAVARQKLRLGTLFNDPAVVKDDDAVGEAHGRKTMRNNEGGPSGRSAAESFHHNLFCHGVEAAGRLVKYKNGRITQDRPGDRNALLLPAGQRFTPLGNCTVVSVRHLFYELVGVSQSRRGANLLVAGTGATKRNVFTNCAAEEQGVLQNQADLFTQRKQSVVPDVFTVDANPSVARVIKARNQTYQGALARSCGPDDSNLLARNNRKANVAEHRPPRLVLKPNTPEVYGAFKPGSWTGPLAVSQLTTYVHHVDNGFHAYTCPIE